MLRAHWRHPLEQLLHVEPTKKNSSQLLHTDNPLQFKQGVTQTTQAPEFK